MTRKRFKLMNIAGTWVLVTIAVADAISADPELNVEALTPPQLHIEVGDLIQQQIAIRGVVAPSSAGAANSYSTLLNLSPTTIFRTTSGST